MKKILIVDSDKVYSSIIADFLTQQGYFVQLCHDGSQAYWRIKEQHWHLIITEFEIGVITSIQLIHFVKTQTKTPVLVLTTRTEERYEHDAFDAGCEDYLKKNISLSLLLKRVERILSTKNDLEKELHFLYSDIVKVDLIKRIVLVEDINIYFTFKEYEILKLLMTKAGQAFSRSDIIDHIWGSDSDAYTRVVDTHIVLIRKKIKVNAIEAIRGFGYRWALPVEYIFK